MKKPWTDRFGDFMAGKGFYIVLFACVAAIGISGYYLFSSLAGGGDATVSGPAKVVVTPTPPPSPAVTLSPDPIPTPVKPTVKPTKPTVTPAPAPATPSATPSPSPVPSPKPAVATAYVWPVKGEVVDAYSPDVQRRDVTMDDWRTHAGVDIAAEIGTQVKAAGNGTVERISTHDLLGTTVTIDHGNGVKSVYSNLGELPTVAEGDTVSAGEVLGSVGATAKGESEQVPHLHLAFYKNDVSADPMAYLPKG